MLKSIRYLKESLILPISTIPNQTSTCRHNVHVCIFYGNSHYNLEIMLKSLTYLKESHRIFKDAFEKGFRKKSCLSDINSHQLLSDRCVVYVALAAIVIAFHEDVSRVSLCVHTWSNGS